MSDDVQDHRPLAASDLLGKTISIVDASTVEGVCWLGFSDGTHLAIHAEISENGDAKLVACAECAAEFVRE
tara:strand:- start:2754 stop:2966 length:213 start_codon:yes stop_codon:yes gene_type:complete